MSPLLVHGEVSNRKVYIWTQSKYRSLARLSFIRHSLIYSHMHPLFNQVMPIEMRIYFSREPWLCLKHNLFLWGVERLCQVVALGGTDLAFSHS